jgi:hypothetical protein
MVRIRLLRFFMLLPSLLALVGLGLCSLNPAAGFTVMLIAFVLFGLFVFLIVCPQCGKSPYVRKALSPGPLMPATYSTPIAESVCSDCGHPF